MWLCICCHNYYYYFFFFLRVDPCFSCISLFSRWPMFSLILSTFYIIWLNIIHQNIYKVVNSSVALPSQISGSKLVVQAFHIINYLFPFLWHTASLLQSKTHTYTHQCLGRLSFRYRLFMYRNMATFVNEVCCCILPHHTFNRVIIAEPTWYLTNIKKQAFGNIEWSVCKQDNQIQ